MLFVDVVTHRVLYRNSQYSKAQVKKKMKIKQSLRKLLKQNRGMVGIEAAIVLIAFVIVAAAFAFMVVNMGLFATQSSKQTIQTGISEASSPLVVDGDIMIHATNTAPYAVDSMVIPLQVIGVRYVPMDQNSTQVTVTVSNGKISAAEANGYLGVNFYDPGLGNNATLDNLVTQVKTNVTSATGVFSELFIGNSNNNTALDSNEKGYLVVDFVSATEQSLAMQTIYLQIRPEQGVPLAVSFVVPAQLAPGWSPVGT
jgi:flagellin FlaB